MGLFTGLCLNKIPFCLNYICLLYLFYSNGIYFDEIRELKSKDRETVGTNSSRIKKKWWAKEGKKKLREQRATYSSRERGSSHPGLIQTFYLFNP